MICASTGRAASGAALAVALWLAPLAGRADAATLRWKFKPGESFHYRQDQKTVTQLKAPNQEYKVTNTQTTDMTWKVGAVAADGTAEITQTIDRIQAKVDGPFGSFEYDSKADKAPEGLLAAQQVQLIKAQVGAVFQYKMSPRGELSDVKVPESLVKTLKELTPAGAPGELSEEGLKNMIHESSLALPAEDLTPGKSWVRPVKMPSPIGTMSFEKTYTYEGPADGAQKIGLKVKVSMEPAADNKADVKLGAQEGSGTFLFDNNAGRVASSNVAQKLELMITFMNQQVTRTNETTTSMKLVDGK
jgi:hypothetical protein